MFAKVNDAVIAQCRRCIRSCGVANQQILGGEPCGADSGDYALACDRQQTEDAANWNGDCRFDRRVDGILEIHGAVWPDDDDAKSRTGWENELGRGGREVAVNHVRDFATSGQRDDAKNSARRNGYGRLFDRCAILFGDFDLARNDEGAGGARKDWNRLHVGSRRLRIQECRISDLQNSGQRFNLRSDFGSRIGVDNTENNRCRGSSKELSAESSSSNVADDSEGVGLDNTNDAVDGGKQRERVCYLYERNSNYFSICADFQD